jgi:hypothetical protein
LKKAATQLELDEQHLRDETSSLARKTSSRRESSRDLTASPTADAPAENSAQRDLGGFLADPTFRLLASCVLNDQDARLLILELPWRELLENDPSGFPLIELLDSCADGGETASFVTLLTKVSSEAESALSQVQNDPLPADPVNLAQACWNELQKRRLRARIRQLSNRQRSPNLSHEEALGIHGQIVDLQTRLRQIP